MRNFLFEAGGRYARWLHTRWPAGRVEPLPEAGEDGKTAIAGVRVAGDLAGVPLLKFAGDSGARAVRAILAEPDFRRAPEGSPELDLAVVGGGVAGISAAIEAAKAGLRFQVFEAARPFSTIANFPKAKPIFTYPVEMRPSGGLLFTAAVKEELLDELERQRKEYGIEPAAGRVDRIVRRGGRVHVHLEGGAEPIPARRAIVAIGRSGDFRRLDCPGGDLGKVFNRLHDPKEYSGRNVLVVGGGDSALEAAISLAESGARVILSYRGQALSRPKPANIERLAALARQPTGSGALPAPGAIRRAPGTLVAEIREREAGLRHEDGRVESLPNDAVFTMIGREAPLDFFRRSRMAIRGEWTGTSRALFVLFVLFCTLLYSWKDDGWVGRLFAANGWFPHNLPRWLERLPEGVRDPATLLGTIAAAAYSPGFHYALAYTLLVLWFGARRIRRSKTPYVMWQTMTLAAIQVIPLFLLPFVLLPWAGQNGWFDRGVGKAVADNLFPAAAGEPGRAYWHAFGLILAWPLFLWNVFTERPSSWWLAISFAQTFVIIPLMVRRWGKGAYCGWICPCGALAETLGDAHRHRMPHGPIWNRLNMLGQAVLLAALALLAARVATWIHPVPSLNRFYYGFLSDWRFLGIELNYRYLVDIFLAGVIGVGCYFHFSGRVWCRFACPLAALMHIYARFSRFRIFADKPKCISCNVCTSVCHQGVDVMNFANKGLAMEDPECVRCSACVRQCPTGVLTFGYLDGNGRPVADRLPASAFQSAGASVSSAS